MSKRLASKYKINRRLGLNLWGRDKSPVNKRAYGPGQHGQHKGKPTDYGTQLLAKQKLKAYYGNVSEKQLRKYYAEAIRRRGDTSEHLIGLLESRLDAVVYRMKFVPTVFASRQFINHGHILVNGKRVDIPSALVSAGDVVAVAEKSQSNAFFKELKETNNSLSAPAWLDADQDKLTGTVTRFPNRDEIDVPVNEQAIVELYSK